MLERVVSYIQEKDLGDLSHHFPEGPLAAFLEMVESGTYPANMTLGDLILKSARNEAFVICEPSKHAPSPDNSRVTTVDLDALKCLSVPNGLLSNFGGEWYQVVVYQRPSSDYVMLYYPSDNTWEGKKPEDRYTLTVHTANELFDGSNGVVHDSDGTKIQFKRMSTIQRKKPRL